MTPPATKTWLDRALSPITDVRAGEGATALLLLANVFLLLLCYAVIKTVREPLILLGGGAEIRSYAAAGQALLLVAFVPLYGWFASRVGRVRLLVGMTLFFILCIELFTVAVTMRVPYVGVAFFIWVGIFNVSLVAQFWSLANDIYTKEAGLRLFPLLVIGMTAGAPFGSLVAGRLFRLGLPPQLILQVSAVLLAVSAVLYALVNRRETVRTGREPEPVASALGGFGLVLASPYLRLVAALVVLLNVVNTTGEYIVARLLTDHVALLAAGDGAFNKTAYIGAFSADYQLSVNVAALLLQAFVASRLVKHAGLRGVLLALPLIALGGYAVIAAGAGFSVVRWIKTAENATDYSIMNTARQLLWLPATREEKYKAKQAIDAFFVRGGDVLSAVVVFVGTSMLHLDVATFALVNTVLTFAWLAVALLILTPRATMSWTSVRRYAPAAAALALLLAPTSAFAQESRQELLAAARAIKAERLEPPSPEPLEQRIAVAEGMLLTQRPVYTFIGSAYPGGGLALGPGFRAKFAETGAFDTHASWSVKNYKAVDVALTLPRLVSDRLTVQFRGNYLDAPDVAFFGLGNDSERTNTSPFAFQVSSVGGAARFKGPSALAVGASADVTTLDAPGIAPTYERFGVFAEIDTRTSPRYTRSGGLYRVDWTNNRQLNGDSFSFGRLDAQASQFVPLLRENWVIAVRALASVTTTSAGNEVPYFLMPDLGGPHTLRGYQSWRFRGPNRLLLSGEYRWTAGPFVDMALFMDAGKVADRASDLDLRNLHKSFGIGASLHSFTSTVVRLELARGTEGTSFGISFSPSF